MPAKFELSSKFQPAGDQPAAIKKILEGIREGKAAIARVLPRIVYLYSIIGRSPPLRNTDRDTDGTDEADSHGSEEWFLS